MTLKEDKIKWYKIYLEEYYNILKQISKEEYLAFINADINVNKSYYVIADSELLLKKFAAYFLVKEYSRFKTYMIPDFVFDLQNHELDILMCETVILYNHKHLTGVGGAENYMWKTTLDGISRRSRNKLRRVTLLLTERDVPYIRNSGELEIIDLNNLKNPKDFKSNGVDTVTESEEMYKSKLKNEVAQTTVSTTNTGSSSKNLVDRNAYID